MTWQLLLAISILGTSISTIIQKILLSKNKVDPIACSITFQLIAGIIIGLFTLMNGFKFPNLIPLIPNLILMSIFYGAGDIFSFYALQITDASEYTIIFASRALFTIVGSVLILHEKFLPSQIFGTFLIITSIVLVFWKKDKFSFNKGFIFALLAALCFGLAFTNDAFIIKSGFDVPTYLTLAFIFPALMTWLFYPKSTSKMKPLFSNQTLIKVFLFGFIYSISAIAYFTAYKVGKNSAQIAPLNQTTIIVTLLLSIIFLNERKDLPKKIIGAFIAFIGVLFLI